MAFTYSGTLFSLTAAVNRFRARPLVTGGGRQKVALRPPLSLGTKSKAGPKSREFLLLWGLVVKYDPSEVMLCQRIIKLQGMSPIKGEILPT